MSSNKQTLHQNGNGAGAPLSGDILVAVRDLQKAYHTPAGDFYALKEVNLEVQRGEFLAVTGRSGAGKSTLINMVTGIDRITAGSVRVNGHHLQQMSEEARAAWRGEHVGIVFQFFHLLPALTCAQNVMLPMDFAGLFGNGQTRRQRALHLLDQVGIAEHADKLPSEVSGGQRQRVAIARALANDPDFIAADEPTGSLDSRTAAEVVAVFRDLVDNGRTVLMVTHDPEMADRVDRVVHLEDGRTVAGQAEAHDA